MIFSLFFLRPIIINRIDRAISYSLLLSSRACSYSSGFLLTLSQDFPKDARLFPAFVHSNCTVFSSLFQLEIFTCICFNAARSLLSALSASCTASVASRILSESLTCCAACSCSFAAASAFSYSTPAFCCSASFSCSSVSFAVSPAADLSKSFTPAAARR